MSQLESLLAISRLQSERHLAALQQKRRSIAYLTQQLSELKDYSGYYQDASAGREEDLAALFTHRKKFVSQLHKQIDELSDRIDTLNIDANSFAERWRVFDARQNAIDSIYQKKCLLDSHKQESIGQGDIDEIARLICAQTPSLDDD